MSHGYSVRVSPRAKRVNLSMSAADGLVVVVPKGYDLRRVPALLELDENRRWIERAATRLSAARHVPLDGVDTACPETILLPSIGEVWPVEYQQGAGASVVLRQSGGNRLVLSGATGNQAGCRAVLDKWLRLKARQHLIPWLAALSADLDLPFARVSIRAQRSRWGSCSQRKSINLNLKLLFLPPELVRYVLVHELCHTVHPNHSADFWRLVARHEPGFQERRRDLRMAARYMPGWLAGN